MFKLAAPISALVPLPLDLLRPWNTHWGGGPVSPLVKRHPAERAPVVHLVRNLLDPPGGQWEVLAGPRQIGKTTSLGHVAERLVREHGVAARSVAIVPLDQPTIQAGLGAGLDELVAVLSTQHPPREDSPLFLLLDEVQELPEWSKRLKAAWDRHHPLVRVLATGSSALRMIRPVEADFPGRIRIQTIHPMKFREVLLAHPDAAKHASADAWSRIEATARATRESVGAPELDNVRERLTALHEAIEGASPTLPAFVRSVFVEYCTWGGYPAARPGTDRGIVGRREVFEQAWNAVLGKDLPAVGILKSREFGLLFQHVALNPGGKFVPHSLARTLGVRAESVASWKRVLEDALLVQQLPPLKPSLRPDSGKDKAYLTDPGWHTYLRGVLDASAVDPSVLGLLVETVLVDHARRLQFAVLRSADFPKGYVQDPEVDVAVSLGTRWLLLESKFRDRTRGGNLDEAGGKGDLRVYATRDRFDTPAGGPLLVPAAEWALVC